ncbi:MAG TPA: YifB family Mg chelatase-like AAA ATPase [Candidatus Woesebacteria bacterium]|nr:YifB family Mg chelatase-like AAA ATPase [Candidatus Woesebacteria bacterium]
MLSKINSCAIVGLQGILVEVEVDVAERGFPTVTIVGLPNKSIDEAKDRVRTAITNAKYEMPDSRITVNLAPADIPKSGSSFDIPIALGILASSGIFNSREVQDSIFIGELSLEGNVRKVPGIISLLLLAKEKNIKKIFLPDENKQEAILLDDIEIYPIKTILELILHITGKQKIQPFCPEIATSDTQTIIEYDFSSIKGQEQAKRALEIAAAGFHNIFLNGPPGAGKTLLSRSFPSILPFMDKHEILEVAKIYSAVGLLTPEIFQGIRQFRSPHHTTSRVGLIGGGTQPTPGEISLAHRGVLFLDEFPEFPRTVLESMRQPLEDGFITVSRAAGTITYPARFLLLAASNPCPCGFLTHPTKECICAPGTIVKYKKRLSGPILDRIDIHIQVPPVEVDKLSHISNGESSEVIKKRITKARDIQKNRFKKTQIQFNSEMKSADIERFCNIESEAQLLLKQAVDKLGISARAYFKVIKVAQTIADLDGRVSLNASHIGEALQYRAGG